MNTQSNMEIITWPQIINFQDINLINSILEKLISNKPYYFIYKNKTNDKITQIYGLLKEVNGDKITIEDVNNKLNIFKCNTCKRKYWGELENQNSFLKCTKTLGCKGKLIEETVSQPKNLIISNISNILDSENKPINFQKLLKSNPHTKDGDVMKEQVLSFNNITFISLAQVKKKKKKEYEEFKKRVWTPDNEATYDYWANLYGKGLTPEDTKQRQEFADSMVKNN